MKSLLVLQHVEAEYLGLIEDHFENRMIRFQYVRPFVPGGKIPEQTGGHDALVVLGSGPYGTVSGHILPSMGPEIRLVKAFLAQGLPVIGIGTGAILLALAAGGGADDAPLRFEIVRALRTPHCNLDLPKSFPLTLYLRDKAVLPPSATVLASADTGEPLVFSVAPKAIGFFGHPGLKSGMVEDLIMEFDETPPDTAATLDRLRSEQRAIAESLDRIMVALIAATGLMETG
jgi:GMP synthase-like glutamine amidotransferase